MNVVDGIFGFLVVSQLLFVLTCLLYKKKKTAILGVVPATIFFTEHFLKLGGVLPIAVTNNMFLIAFISMFLQLFVLEDMWYNMGRYKWE